MNIFQSIGFGFNKEKALAFKLASQLAKEIPPALMQKKRESLSVNKITRLLEKTYAAVSLYKKDNKMGFLSRTVFANYFQWELKNLNYPNDFATMATEGLIVELVKPKKSVINANEK